MKGTNQEANAAAANSEESARFVLHRKQAAIMLFFQRFAWDDIIDSLDFNNGANSLWNYKDIKSVNQFSHGIAQAYVPDETSSKCLSEA